ncbi:diaminobutyrate acetyltransferase [Streptomyces sp. NPDC049954]|uniref:diaminobutyrate acetyltransferase n=1 Tax=Streptomyces sp. NPDC049954 TaxID=3155779 RepID=UPI003433A0C4
MFTSACLRNPDVRDGSAIWGLAREVGLADLDSPNSYLMWCRDFAATSVVARPTAGGAPLGFVTGYRRPEAADTLFVWQVAVARVARDQGLELAMLEWLAGNVPGLRYMETTIAQDDDPSTRLFSAFAAACCGPPQQQTLFVPDQFPDPHEPEVLLRISL